MKKAMILSLLAVFSFVISAGTAFALMPEQREGVPYHGVDFEALYKSGDRIYFGAYRHANEKGEQDPEGYECIISRDENPTPVLWRVMGEESSDGKLVLMSEYVIDFYFFDDLYNIWSLTSEYENFKGHHGIRKWLNDEDFPNGLLSPDQGKKTFTDAEYKKAVVESEVSTSLYDVSADTLVLSRDVVRISNNIGPVDESKDKFYLLWGTHSFSDKGRVNNRNKVSWWANDVADLSAGQVSGDLGEGVKKAASLKNGVSEDYWLRSPGPEGGGSDRDPLQVRSKDNPGDVTCDVALHRYLGVRPVFKFKPESVIFISEVGGTSLGAVPSDVNYAKAGGSGRNYKLTLLNDALSAGTVSVSGEPHAASMNVGVMSGDLVNVSAAGASAGTSLTYKLVGSDDKIVRYNKGNLTSVQIDTKGLSEDTYAAYVWAQKDEAINSNEGSAPKYFNLVVLSAGSGGVPSDPGDPGEPGDGAVILECEGRVSRDDWDKFVALAVSEEKTLELEVITGDSIEFPAANLISLDKGLEVDIIGKGYTWLNSAALAVITNGAGVTPDSQIRLEIAGSTGTDTDDFGIPLNDLQKSSLRSFGEGYRGVFDVSVSVVGGSQISQFSPGTLEVGLRYRSDPSKDVSGSMKVYHIDNEGIQKDMGARYDDGVVFFTTSSLSVYALVYESERNAGGGGGGGCASGFGTFAPITAAAVTGLCLRRKRR
jgi:hypothetical protein